MGGKATIWGGGNPTIKRGKSGYIVGFPRGKGYYIASFPGERLLYSQFSGGGEIWLGGKATIQYRNMQKLALYLGHFKLTIWIFSRLNRQLLY